jgi:hypothetical protein
MIKKLILINCLIFLSISYEKEVYFKKFNFKSADLYKYNKEIINFRGKIFNINKYRNYTDIVINNDNNIRITLEVSAYIKNINIDDFISGKCYIEEYNKYKKCNLDIFKKR